MLGHILVNAKDFFTLGACSHDDKTETLASTNGNCGHSLFKLLTTIG